jgi:hypothetical protein
MKKILFISMLMIPLHIFSYTNYPISIIIKNGTGRTLTLSIEYRLDQLYQHETNNSQPIVPNNTHYKKIGIIYSGKSKSFQVPAYAPCAQQFCFLDNNLKHYGFRQHYKKITGELIIDERERPLKFKQVIHDGKTATFVIENNDFYSL